MLHNDSITINLLEAVNDYARTRNTAKVLEFTGGLLLVTAGILIATGTLPSSDGKIYPMVIVSSGILIGAGWITDHIAVSKLKLRTSPDY